MYDAIVFIGGAGIEAYLNDSEMKAIAENASDEGKLIGAISVAPCILANAGVLNGQKATVFPTTDNIATLESNGATYEEQDVIRYGNFVTANGPSASIKFARKIMEILEG
jgi:protease I